MESIKLLDVSCRIWSHVMTANSLLQLYEYNPLAEKIFCEKTLTYCFNVFRSIFGKKGEFSDRVHED